MKKLYRMTQDRKIAGVCGGLGAYFDIDPVFFRLFFLISILFGGLGAVAYLVMWLMVPAQDGARREGSRLRLSATTARSAASAAGWESSSTWTRCSFASPSWCSPSSADWESCSIWCCGWWFRALPPP